uniref:N/A n=1 Tax=Ganoderma boninense TaxID=34458 RepID=A0A5K1JUD9_9APHY|nr:N/A [Ganoderma boninense]
MADPNFENPVILDLMSSYGPILIGAIFQSVLYGMAVIQIFMYFNNYEKDSIWMKLYVMLIWAIETASTISVLAAMWPVLILRWGSLHELAQTQLYVLRFSIRSPSLISCVQPILHRVWLTGLSTFLVHMFFIYRIYMVSGRSLYPLLLIPFTLYQMIETWVYVNRAYAYSWFIGLSTGTHAPLPAVSATPDLGTSGRAVIAFVDIAIVGLMIFSLLKDGYPTFQNSRKMIFRLMVLTINTGVWTAIFAIVDLALILPFQNQLYYAAVDFPLTSLYLNSLLANLNAREYVRSAAVDVSYNSYPMFLPIKRIPSRLICSRCQQGHGIHINTTTDTAVYGDHDILTLKASLPLTRLLRRRAVRFR